MQKSADAYRTISEVAEDLTLPQHVLRFWETRFPQVKPMKRGGNRRFYRPEDVELLRAIKILLYGEGYTIKGVQRILKEQGPRVIVGMVHDPASREMTGPDFRHPAGAATSAPESGPRRGGRQWSDALANKPVGEQPRPVPRSAAAPRQDMMRQDVPARRLPAPRATSEPAALADRLHMVLADLAECARILAAGRDGQEW